MSRITEKLGLYEDIDEKIGITYPILTEALLNGFDTKYNGHVNPFPIEIDLKLKCFIDSSNGEHYYFKDYGKNWILKQSPLSSTSMKAYNKIDNLCCLNANRYQKDFFQDYNGEDEDLCKDVNDMIDSLEEIKDKLERLDVLEAILDESFKNNH